MAKLQGAAAASKERAYSIVGSHSTSYKPQPTDQRWRVMRTTVHNFLERPRGYKAARFGVIIIILLVKAYGGDFLCFLATICSCSSGYGRIARVARSSRFSFSLCMVLLCLALSVFSTMPDFEMQVAMRAASGASTIIIEHFRLHSFSSIL